MRQRWQNVPSPFHAPNHRRSDAPCFNFRGENRVLGICARIVCRRSPQAAQLLCDDGPQDPLK